MAKIAVDYDNTISIDVPTWITVIDTLKDAGHDVFVVTFRERELDWNDDLALLEEHDIALHFTNGVAKKFWCTMFGPGDVNIWIDDKPETIFNNGIADLASLQEWRDTRVK